MKINSCMLPDPAGKVDRAEKMTRAKQCPRYNDGADEREGISETDEREGISETDEREERSEQMSYTEGAEWRKGS